MLVRFLAGLAALSLIASPIPTAAAVEFDTPMPSFGGDHDYPSDGYQAPSFQIAQLLGVTNAAAGGILAGTPTAMTITSPDFSSTTDLTPASQNIDGWTAAVVFKGAVVGGTYSLGSYSSPVISIPVTSPGFDSTGTATTVSRTVVAMSSLRKPTPNATSLNEVANSGNARITFSLNDRIRANSTGENVGTASFLSGAYTSGGTASRASSVTVVNNSSLPWQTPVCTWVTPPMQRVTGGGDTVEAICGAETAQGGKPVAAVKFTRTDGTNSIVKTVSTMTQSAKHISFSCTATNGSAVLASCGSTAGVIDGMRFTVPGIPGQPKLLSHTSTSLTFGQTTTCTPTTGGGETISATPGNGEALGDGAFLGATITDARLAGGTGTIVVPTGIGSTSGSSTTLTLASVSAGQFQAGMFLHGTGITEGTYIASISGLTITMSSARTVAASTAITAEYIGATPGSVATTAINISTNAASGTATSGACTINHVFQGTSGAVTATPGNPVFVYSATFTSADYTAQGLTNGAVWTRLQAYPVMGDSAAILDSQTGADGTRCDYFWNIAGTAGAGTCNASNGAWFNVNGTNLSPNLHNLSAWLDAAGSYSPVYAFVSGTAGASPTVSTSSADPGSTKYYATVNAANAAIVAYNNNTTNRPGGTNHNDSAGGVICLLAAGSPYAGFGGDLFASTAVARPALRLTSVLSGSACPASGAAGSDVNNVNLTYGASTNNGFSNILNVANINMDGANWSLRGYEGINVNSFQTSALILEGVRMHQTGGNPTMFQVGDWWIYNSIDDSSSNSNYALSGYSNTTSALAYIGGNTLICGSFTAQNESANFFNSAGNVGWICNPSQTAGLDSVSYAPQPLSVVTVSDKWLANKTAFAIAQNYGGNILMVNDVIEIRNGGQGAMLASGDSRVAPIWNVNLFYNTVVGGKTNWDYEEGNSTGQQNSGGLATGGTLPAGTYQVAVVFGPVATPTVESSTDWYTPGLGGIVVGGSGSGSMVTSFGCFQRDYAISAIYIDTGTTPGHYAAVAAGAKLAAGGVTTAGQDARGLAACQSVTITGIGSAHTFPTNLPGQNVNKLLFKASFNNMAEINQKTESYGGAIVTPKDGRIGDWPLRFGVGSIGNVFLTGTIIGSGINYSSGLADALCALCTYNPTNNPNDFSWVKYKSDRSMGIGTTPLPATALNLGMGDYCMASTTPHGFGQVPAGMAAWPVDIQGRTRLNDATGASGPYEKNC
jgi:hypothetical protein